MVEELIAGRYELKGVVGTGGMSDVHRAHDRLLERDVALKILHDAHVVDAEAIERFRREARAVAQLSHPNIITVIDRGEADGKQFIVFELIEGESLKDLIARAGPLPVRQALAFAIDIGGALAFAHERGIVHRDVKPQNVLVDGGGEAKVGDFGIARSADAGGVTQTGTVLGTSSYMAPEQASGGDVDACTDIYSLGVVLFELLTGDVPFDGDSFLAVATRHVHDPVPDIRVLRPDVPERVVAAVERAMAKEPSDRFGSMADMVAELQACLDEPARLETEPEEATMVSAPARARRRGRGRWPLVVALALSTAALVAAALVIALVDVSAPGLSVLDPPPPAQPVELASVAAFDPEGDGQEHPEDVPAATDGDPTTFWTTERYEDFARLKSGVGLVIDAGRPVELSELTVSTTTPGFRARIDAGSSPGGPFRPVSEPQTVGESATFDLDGADERYYVVWIVDIPGGVARINEVTAGSG